MIRPHHQRSAASIILLLGVLATGCSASTGQGQAPSPAGLPTTSTSATSGPSDPEPPLASASEIPAGLSLQDARWTQIGGVAVGGSAEGSLTAGFEDGYVAVGGVSDVRGVGPVAWFSGDGRDWVSTPLAQLVHNCPSWGPEGDEMVGDAEARAIATNGRQVLVVGEVTQAASCGAPLPIAWVSSDGRTWQRSAPFPDAGPDLRATAAWASPEGWRAATESGIWASADGLSWQRIADRPAWAFELTGTSDGTMLAAGEGKLWASQGDLGWHAIDAPSACGGARELVAPVAQGRDAWFVAAQHPCASYDLTSWANQAVDAEVLGGANTRYGPIAFGDACFGAGVSCEPDPRAYQLAPDGSWLELEHPPIFWGRTLVDGPAGVLMLGDSRGDDARTEVWHLDG